MPASQVEVIHRWVMVPPYKTAKFHYMIVRSRTLCGRYLNPDSSIIVSTDENDPRNCSVCKAKLGRFSHERD